MRVRQRLLVGLLAAGLTAGCDSEPLVPVVIEPMTEAVAWANDTRSRATVNYLLRNRTDRTLYLRTLCSVRVEFRVEDEWRDVPEQIVCPLALQAPIWLAPNEPYGSQSSFPLLPGWQDAEYRLRFDELTDELGADESTFGDPLPLDYRVSAPFRVRVP